LKEKIRSVLFFAVLCILFFTVIFLSCIPALEKKQQNDQENQMTDNKDSKYPPEEIISETDAFQDISVEDISHDAEKDADAIFVDAYLEMDLEIKDLISSDLPEDIINTDKLNTDIFIKDNTESKEDAADNDTCIANCTNKECGNDGCGGFCGTCSGETVCNFGICIEKLKSEIPDTGQEKCYGDSSEMNCPSNGSDYFGQDAQYQANPMNFTDNGNETVTDNVTKLMWMKCPAGMSGEDCLSGTVGEMDWQTAVNFCANSKFAGFEDWLLPNRYELQTIVHYEKWNPTIMNAFFPNAGSSFFWTTNWYAGDSAQAWYVLFTYGSVNFVNKPVKSRVRCVRQGSYILWQFNDNGDETVTDEGAGLMWQKTPSSETYIWKDALKYCRNLDLGGHYDWRLPDVKELSTIADYSKDNPSLNTSFFPDSPKSYYWTSTTFFEDQSKAWHIYFVNGIIDYDKKNVDYFVRCVR
jgi:hypothetical protein